MARFNLWSVSRQLATVLEPYSKRTRTVLESYSNRTYRGPYFLYQTVSEKSRPFFDWKYCITFSLKVTVNVAKLFLRHNGNHIVEPGCSVDRTFENLGKFRARYSWYPWWPPSIKRLSLPRWKLSTKATPKNVKNSKLNWMRMFILQRFVPFSLRSKIYRYGLGF